MTSESGNRSPIAAGRELARGSAWMIGMRWAIRGIGLVSTVILARLLTPDDFGVVAMAMVSVAILEVFTQSGVDLALLRTTEPTREHYDAAWSMEIIQGFVLAIVLYVTAPYVGGHFEDPRVTVVVRILSLRAAIGGFQNIGVVNFRRELAFGREFQFGIFKKLATFSVTVVTAFLLKNYWALVIGQVVGRLLEVGISYLMSAYRPRFSLARVGEIWGFSRWLILSRFARLVNKQLDRWVVGSVGGAAAMGNYYIATDMASSPSDEIVVPMSRAAFPVYSRLADDPDQLGETFTRALSSMTAITFVMGLGIAVVADDFVRVVLGDRWLEAIPLIPWLGIFGALYGIVHTIDIFLLATGRERLAALLTVGNAAMLVPVLWAVSTYQDIELIAAAKAATALLFVLSLMWAATRRPPLTFRNLWRAIWPPLAAALIMAGSVKALQAGFDVARPVFGLARDVAFGAIVYSLATFVIWTMRGRPDGVEREMLSRISARFRRN